MNKEALIETPENLRPHVVLLGAGASRAAFPSGEETGKHLPLMNDFVSSFPRSCLRMHNILIMHKPFTR